jgi:hypothetical protein
MWGLERSGRRSYAFLVQDDLDQATANLRRVLELGGSAVEHAPAVPEPQVSILPLAERQASPPPAPLPVERRSSSVASRAESSVSISPRQQLLRLKQLQQMQRGVDVGQQLHRLAELQDRVLQQSASVALSGHTGELSTQTRKMTTLTSERSAGVASAPVAFTDAVSVASESRRSAGTPMSASESRVSMGVASVPFADAPIFASESRVSTGVSTATFADTPTSPRESRRSTGIAWAPATFTAEPQPADSTLSVYVDEPAEPITFIDAWEAPASPLDVERRRVRLSLLETLQKICDSPAAVQRLASEHPLRATGDAPMDAAQLLRRAKSFVERHRQVQASRQALSSLQNLL